MQIGIDLDNTIIRYDELFVRLATERGLLSSGVARNKRSVRDDLRAQGKESLWTEMQGIAYGRRMKDAVPFEGVHEFFARCAAARIQWWIISHRTEVPILGEPVDLHAAAREWLIQQGLISSGELDRVKLSVTKQAKLAAIEQTGCDVFIDDLPELLCDPAFPGKVRRILFDPADQNADRAEYERATSWFQIAEILKVGSGSV